jgi:hypothetical protein
MKHAMLYFLLQYCDGTVIWQLTGSGIQNWHFRFKQYNSGVNKCGKCVHNNQRTASHFLLLTLHETNFSQTSSLNWTLILNVNYIVYWDLRFSQQRRCRLCSSGLWHHVVLWVTSRAWRNVSPSSSGLKMEVIYYFKILVSVYKTAQWHKSEEHIWPLHCCENLGSQEQITNWKMWEDWTLLKLLRTADSWKWTWLTRQMERQKTNGIHFRI